MESQFLRTTLKEGTYALADEAEILRTRAKQRDHIKWLQQKKDTKEYLGV